MNKIKCTIVLLILSSTFTIYGQSIYEKPVFSITQKIGYPFTYSLSLNVKSLLYEVHTYSQTEEKGRYFKLSPIGFSLRFSPVLYYSNLNKYGQKKYKKALSFFYGGLNKHSFLNNLTLTEQKKLSTGYTGIKFLPNYFISCASTKADSSIGIEFSSKQFNAFVLSDKNVKEEWPSVHCLLAYKNTMLYEENINLAFIFYTRFMPDRYSQFSLNTPSYNSIYSTNFIFTLNKNDTYYNFLLTGNMALDHKNKKTSFAGKTEFNFFKQYAGFNTGIYIKQKENASLLKTKTIYDNTFVFFIQPKLYLGNIETTGMFKIEKSINQKLKNDRPIFYAGGIDINMYFRYVILKNSFFYEYGLYNSSSNIIIKPNIFWLKSISLSGEVVCTDKFNNPFIINKYIIKSNINFKYNSNIKFKISGGLSQKNITIKNHNSLTKWEKPILFSTITTSFNKKTKAVNHNVIADISFTNKKTIFKFSISYKIQF